MKSAIRIVGFLIVLAALGSFALAQGASSGVTGKGTAGQIPVSVGTHQVGNPVIRQDSDSTIVVESSLVSFNGLSGSVASGNAGGVEGHSSSEFGTGVFGSATSTTGGTAGVLGLSASSEGSGVRGVSTNIAILGRNEICTSSCVHRGVRLACLQQAQAAPFCPVLSVLLAVQSSVGPSSFASIAQARVSSMAGHKPAGPAR